MGASIVITGERKGQLVETVRDAFEIAELRAIVDLVDRKLTYHVTWNETRQIVAASVFRAAHQLGGDEWVEAVARSARRARCDNPSLANAVLSCWRYAGGLEPHVIDDLVAALVVDQVTLDEVEHAAARTAKPFRRLRSELGREAIADLVERLAGHQAEPGSPLPVFRAVLALRRTDRPRLADWVARVCPSDSCDGAAADDGPLAPPSGATRMLIVLYPEDDDDYSVEVYLSNPPGLPRLVAALDRASLVDIPARIHDQLLPGTRLFEAMYTSEIEQIDVVLPLRDMLAAVDEWTLRGQVLSIGETYRVVVRCLERNLTRRYPNFLLARQNASAMWREMHALRDRCAVHWIEAAEQLAPDEVRQALRQHAVKRWLVAAICADSPATARRDALELMIRQGVPAAISVRGTAPTPARPLLEPACAQPLRLPAGIHEHRTGRASLPVTLLWDDPDVRPEEWR